MTFLSKTIWRLGLALSLAGVLLTITQIVLLLFDQKTICFNDGCEIVESLTTISPILFNLAGTIYFATLFGTLYMSKGGQRAAWTVLNKLLLLGGIAAEGVLVGFQHFVVDIFCSYCLCILALVVALNLLNNYRHILQSIAVFVAIQAGFAALQFNSAPQADGFSLDGGTLTTMEGLGDDKKLYLFFSSTCVHCEEIIETLEEDPQCTIHFNPIDKVESIELPGNHSLQPYNEQVNRQLLTTFGIREIPALLVSEGGNYALIRGKQNISSAIEQNCYPSLAMEDQSFTGTSQSMTLEELLPAQEDEENCSIEAECEEPANSFMPDHGY